MSFTLHSVVQRARVRSAALRQHDVLGIEGEPALAIASALAPPRLWGYLLDAALASFAVGFARPHDGRVATRLYQGLRHAQQELRGRIDGLLDRRHADVALLALAREGDVLHLSVAGNLSAYLHRERALHRLTPDEPPRDGLLKADPTRSTRAVCPGDLIIAGNGALFSGAKLQRIEEACASDPQVAASQVAALLSADPASQGAAAAAFRLD